VSILGNTQIRGVVQVCLRRMGVQRQHKQLAVKSDRCSSRVPVERSREGFDGDSSAEGNVFSKRSFLAGLKPHHFSGASARRSSRGEAHSTPLSAPFFDQPTE